MSALPIRDETAALALGALDQVERDALEWELTRSPELAREVEEYRELAAMLSFAAPPLRPPTSLRERILASAKSTRPITSAPSAAPNANPAAVTRARSRIVQALPWLALAASLLVLVATREALDTERSAHAVAEQTNQQTNQSLRTELASLDSVVTTLLAPDVETVKLSSTNALPAARMYWNTRSNQVVLAAFNLRPAPTGRTYQLWGIENGKAPVSLGTFNTGADGGGRVRLSVPGGVKIAIGAVTEEPEGGSPQPTTKPFLVGQLRTTD